MRTGKLVSLILVMSVIFCMSASAFGGKGSSQGNQKASGILTLTESETGTLEFMREEEKLARYVYRAMYDRWGSTIFQNIAESEQRHMDAIKTLLDKYSIPDPASEEPGVFTDQSLQELYDDLVDRGAASELEAFRVGALIEEVDIEDLSNAIAETNKIDLQAVYGNLLRGSINHLKAFVAHIEAMGIDYEAQYLSQDEVDHLLAE
jgi:hypothetical protein